MNNGWRQSTWGDEIALEYGKALRGYEGSSGRYRVYGSNGPVGWADKYLADGPGVILGRKGAYRGLEYSPEPFFVIDTAYYVRSLKDHNVRWLYYAIKYHKLGEIDDGSPVPSTTRAAVYVRDVEVPPLTVQRRIADILGSLDDKIELNRRTSETLEAMARTVFRSWFVDFDPVRAKADGQTPFGLDAATAKLFPDSFEPSALGPIPKGWRVGKLEEVAEIVMGSSPAGDTYNEVGIGTPLVNGPVEFGEHFVVKRKWTTEPGRLSKPNDLIFCVRGSTTGRRVVADDVYCLGRGVCSIRSRSGSWAFIHRLIDFSLERLLSRVSGSVFPNLNGPDLKQFEVVIPNEKIVAVYQQQAQPWMNLIAARVRESEYLSATRDALLPRLLSGEVQT